tara:strand:+ start:845 stop:1171 length:327 start_codon:yes stop_codon:yes gene_type:complete
MLLKTKTIDDLKEFSRSVQDFIENYSRATAISIWDAFRPNIIAQLCAARLRESLFICSRDARLVDGQSSDVAAKSDQFDISSDDQYSFNGDKSDFLVNLLVSNSKSNT